MAGDKWMLYGASGFTGRLIAEEAVRRGHRPLLAGRSAEKIRPLAERLGLDHVIISLDETQALHDAVRALNLVMHAAGPYVHTAEPMIRACLAGITNYLDISGEVPVLRDTERYDQAAYERDIVVMPGTGFDVVPTDCLANYVAGQVRQAEVLEIAINGMSSASAGTTKAGLESLDGHSWVRRGGEMTPWPFGKGARWFRFPQGQRKAVPVPWGDLVTAHRSTGIPNITTYMTFKPAMIPLLRLAPLLLPVLKVGPVKALAKRWIERTVHGPDEQMRATARAVVWARAANTAGDSAEAWLEVNEPYRFTAEAAVQCVELALAQHPRGMLTPAQAFGPDFVLDIAGSRRFDSL